MKFKKLFAGVAAAATLLAGMAFGTGAANAAETTVDTAATVTFKASKEKQLTSARLSAYKIADYVNYGTAENPVYGVKTAAGADRAKLAAALTTAGFRNVPTDGTTDLMAWAMNQKKTTDTDGTVTQVQFDQSETRPWNNPSVTRKFADALQAGNTFHRGSVRAEQGDWQRHGWLDRHEQDRADCWRVSVPGRQRIDRYPDSGRPDDREHRLRERWRSFAWV